MNAIAMKWGKVLAVASLVALGVGVLLINLLWVPDHDALLYAFGRTSTTEQTVRVASIGDIIRQQMTDYVTPGFNGRVFVHGTCAFFMGFKLYTLFKLINTAMWCLFTWLVLRTGGLTREKTSVWGWAFGASVVWWVCWYGETAINAAFAINYLWTATATLILFALWKRLRWWMVPFAFLYGWSQECFVLPALVALGGSMAVQSIVERRRAFTWQQVLAWLLILAGACFLCLGPAALARTVNEKTFLLSARIRSVGSLLLLSPIPFACMVIVLWRKWRGRTSVGAFCASFLPSFEWWLFLLAGVGIMLTNGGARTGLTALMAVLVLLARERKWFYIPQGWKVAWVAFVVIWVGISVYFQIQTTHRIQECLARYRVDPQGITCWSRTPAGVFCRSIWLESYNDTNMMHFMREMGQRVPMATFAPWLYNALYVNPAEYFAVAEPVAGTPCYSTPKAPHVLVAKGDVVPSAEECARMAEYLKNVEKVNALPKFVPGRLEVMFPRSDDSYQLFPRNRFVFTAKDGKVYTIFSGDKPEKWVK